MGGLTDQKFVRALEYMVVFVRLVFTQMLRHVILVKVETSENHVRQLKIFDFVSLLNRDVLELMLIIQIGEDIVSDVTSNELGFLLIDQRSLSPVS